MDAHITSVSYLNEDAPEDRQLEIELSNGTTITAESCHESWQQWGGTTDELYTTMPTVEAHNDWLHGGKRPNYTV